eukprot:2007810-Prymnesium_polylepis.1
MYESRHHVPVEAVSHAGRTCAAEPARAAGAATYMQQRPRGAGRTSRHPRAGRVKSPPTGAVPPAGKSPARSL